MADDLDRYVCSLDERGVVKAERELNEIPGQRLSALKTFRDWVVQQRSWLKSPTDARLLLRFLRNKKFGQLKAREKFIQYWTARTKHPHLLANLDPCDNKTAEILRQTFVCMPGHDSQGRKVVISRWGRIDTSGKLYKAVDVIKTLVVFNEYLLLDEQTQVGGIVVLEDFTGFGKYHFAFLGAEHMSTFASIITKAFPLRLNGLHEYNNNPLMEALLAAVKPFLKKKIMGRIHLHGKSMVGVYDHIEKSSLPVEYLPDDYTGPNAGTIDSVIESFMTDIQKPEVREYLLNLSSKQFCVDEKLKPPESELLTESFRSLKTE